MGGLAVALLSLALAFQAPAGPAPEPQRANESPAAPEPPTEAPGDADLSETLLKVRRIFVEDFGDDPVSKQIQAMLVASLTGSKRFIVTENRDRADAILKGSALEKTSQEFFAYGEATSGGAAAGGHSGSVRGSWSAGSGSVSGSSSGGFAAKTASIEDSAAKTETIHDARIAVRLVDPDGDVLWATSQESKGAKYKGASADVADRVVKQLLRDVEKLQRAQAASAN